MSKGGRYLQKKAVPVKRRPKTLIIVLCTLAVLLLATGVFGVVFYNTMLGYVDRAEVIEKDVTMNEEIEQMMGVIEETTEAPETVPTTLPYTPSNQNIVNVLLVGQAFREGEESRMADTMILVTVNKETKTITATSFLRDTYVKLPNYMGHTCGKNRINVCYHLGWTWGDTGGAMEMTSICLEDNFNAKVDYCLEVDFEAFVKIIDILGGVEVELNQPEVDYINERPDHAQMSVELGTNVLNGNTALLYARMRKAEGDGDSDIKRTARQRKIIESLLKKVKDEGFDKLMEIAKTVLPMISTDMTNDEITTCLWEMLPLLPDLKFETATCPAEGTYWGEVIDIIGVPSSVIKYHEGQNKQIMSALTKGTAE